MAAGRRAWLPQISVSNPTCRASELLADVYKFKVLSAMELMQFEEGASSPDSL